MVPRINLTQPKRNVFDDPSTNPYNSPKTINCQQRQVRVQKLRSSVPWTYQPFANQMRLTRELASTLMLASHLANNHLVQEKHLLFAIAKLSNGHIWNIIKREMDCGSIEELKKKLNIESNADITRSPSISSNSWYLKVTDIKEDIELDFELATAFKEIEADMDLLNRRHKIVSVPDIVIKIFRMRALRTQQTGQQDGFFAHINQRIFNNLRYGTPITSVYRPALLEDYMT